jgi:uncharacterized protein (TIGR03437 family)
MIALFVQALAASPRLSPALAAISRALVDPPYKIAFECGAAVLALGAGLYAPRLVLSRTVRLRCAFEELALNRRHAILFAALLPLVIRLGLLPVLGIPEPLIADEFGYLLIADTLAAGRLANPPHPLWQHFEAIYAYHQPAYASIYPIAPALPLLAAKLVGISPWMGVWAGAGAMCGLICWMLQGWVPPKWALAGALIAACRFAIIGPWMNTYWGGAAAAAGGALLLGSLPRVIEKTRVRDSILFGTGLAVLAQSRPYEGFLLSVPIALAVAVWIVAARRPALRARARNAALPLGAAALLLMAGTAYYNSRVTGDARVMPYSQHQKIYGTPQSFYWQEPIRDAPGIHRHKDIADVFRWQLQAYESQFSWESLSGRLVSFWNFYLQPLLTAPLLLLPWICRSRWMAVSLLAGLLVMAGNSLYPFFFPHYAAPLCGLLLLLIVAGMRRMSRTQTGRAAAAALLILTFASACLTALGSLLRPAHVTATNTPRGQAMRELHELGGKHLVLVRYSPRHSFHFGVVYNDADIDGSPVVWARDLGEASNEELLAHFKERTVWRFNPDEPPAKLIPYTTRPFVSKITAGAGRRDDTRDGVSPGGIAVVLGGNFAPELDGTTVAGLLGPQPFHVVDVSAEYGNVLAPKGRRAAPAPKDRGSATREVEAGPCRGEVSVRFGGMPAKVLGVSNFDGREAITVQTPAGLRPGWATATVHACRGMATAKVRVLAAAPGIFQARMGDSHVQAVVLREDGGAVDPAYPARPGEVLHLFATGLGASPKSLIVGVNHQGAPLISATPAEDTPGVFDVAFQLPWGTPPGADIPLSVAVLVNGTPVYSNKSSLPVE